MLPKGKQTFIIDKQGRIINAQPIDDMPNLSWLVPIQPTTVADIEGPVLIHNRKIAASVLDKCFETHEAETINFAWVGDARAVVGGVAAGSDGWVPSQSTADHKPSNASERERIEANDHATVAIFFVVITCKRRIACL